MEDVTQRIIDTLGELQAQALANSTMLEALLMSHPDPQALRKAWNSISAPRIAGTSTDAATRNREVDARVLWHFDKWIRKLDAHHPAAGTPGV
jgi:hypothetical protein